MCEDISHLMGLRRMMSVPRNGRGIHVVSSALNNMFSSWHRYMP